MASSSAKHAELVVKQYLCSLEVSLPLLPSFNVKSGLGVEEVKVEVFLLTLGEALEPLEFMEDVVGVLLDLEGRAVEDFAWQLISDLHSQ